MFVLQMRRCAMMVHQRTGGRPARPVLSAWNCGITSHCLWGIWASIRFLTDLRAIDLHSLCKNGAWGGEMLWCLVIVDAVRKRRKYICRPFQLDVLEKVVFAPEWISVSCLKNRTEELNAPEFHSYRLNTAYVKAPLCIWGFTFAFFFLPHPCSCSNPHYTPREITEACRALEGIFVYVLQRAKNISVPCKTFWVLQNLYCWWSSGYIRYVESWYPYIPINADDSDVAYLG